MPNGNSIPPVGGVSNTPTNLKRLRFSLNQCCYLMDYGFGIHFGLGRSVILTADEARVILDVVPRVGRTALSIRRKVASALRAAELAAEVR